MLCETSSRDAEDIDDDPGRPPTALVAPVDHDVVALGNDQRAFVSPRETTHQEEEAFPPRGNPCTVLDLRGREVLFSCRKVSPIEERVEGLEHECLVSCLLIQVSSHRSPCRALTGTPRIRWSYIGSPGARSLDAGSNN